jgi:hypothetical protein
MVKHLCNVMLRTIPTLKLKINVHELNLTRKLEIVGLCYYFFYSSKTDLLICTKRGMLIT